MNKIELLWYNITMAELKRPDRWCHTLLEMLTDRKYDVKELTADVLMESLVKSEDKHYECKDVENNSVFISYLASSSSGNVGKNDIILILNDKMIPNGSRRCILILDNVKLTPAAKNDIQVYFPRYIFEPFDISALDFNITRVDLVPKHALLTEEESKKVMIKFKITKNEMPKILYEDPVARYMGMLPGQVCEITRISETGGKIKFHRICCL